MSVGDQHKKAQEQIKQQDNIDIRVDLHNAYAFIEGEKASQSFSAFTIEEAHDRFIERVEGQGTSLRPNVLTRIDRTEKNVVAAIAKVRALPPEAFRKPDPKTDVNTDVTSEET